MAREGQHARALQADLAAADARRPCDALTSWRLEAAGGPSQLFGYESFAVQALQRRAVIGHVVRAVQDALQALQKENLRGVLQRFQVTSTSGHGAGLEIGLQGALYGALETAEIDGPAGGKAEVRGEVGMRTLPFEDSSMNGERGLDPSCAVGLADGNCDGLPLSHFYFSTQRVSFGRNAPPDPQVEAETSRRAIVYYLQRK